MTKYFGAWVVHLNIYFFSKAIDKMVLNHIDIIYALTVKFKFKFKSILFITSHYNVIEQSNILKQLYMINNDLFTCNKVPVMDGSF